MQLHTQSPQTLEEMETDFRQQVEQRKCKNIPRRRRKRIIQTESRETMLDFSEEEEKEEEEEEEDPNSKTDTIENLPDVVQDANNYKKKLSMSHDITSDRSVSDHKNSSLSNEVDQCKTENIVSEVTISRKKNSITSEMSDGRSRIDSKVEEFMNEVMSSISEIGNGNPTDGVKKLRGIIKKTLSCEKEEGANVIYIKRGEKPKNKVHFSEENITIEIPRPPSSYFEMVKDTICYFCCFGFLFPNS